MKFLPILLLTVAVAGVSCERHEFEGPNGTKQLHEHHGSHDTEHASHGEGEAHPAGDKEAKEHSETPAH